MALALRAEWLRDRYSSHSLRSDIRAIVWLDPDTSVVRFGGARRTDTELAHDHRAATTGVGYPLTALRRLRRVPVNVLATRMLNWSSLDDDSFRRNTRIEN